jgi:hypothetical protein
MLASPAADAITAIRLSSCYLPLATPISDAKVLTGRQKPMTEVAILFAEIRTAAATRPGLQLFQARRRPGQFAHAGDRPTLLGEDPSDIAKLWDKLCWAGASVGRSGLSTQAIGAFDVALWDLKARRAGLSLAKLLGSHRDSVRCYNTSGGFLHTPLDPLLVNAAASVERGIGGIKLKVGQPDGKIDIQRVSAVREKLGDAVPIMVDANQQWDRPTAQRMCRTFESFNLVWIEPLDAYDHEGHAALAQQFDADRHRRDADQRRRALGPDPPSRRRLPDARRAARGRHHAVPEGVRAGRARRPDDRPHFAMELHVHLAAAIRASRGSSISTGSSRCSTSGSRSPTAASSSHAPGPGAEHQRTGARLDARTGRVRRADT